MLIRNTNELIHSVADLLDFFDFVDINGSLISKKIIL